MNLVCFVHRHFGKLDAEHSILTGCADRFGVDGCRQKENPLESPALDFGQTVTGVFHTGNFKTLAGNFYGLGIYFNIKVFLANARHFRQNHNLV